MDFLMGSDREFYVKHRKKIFFQLHTHHPIKSLEKQKGESKLIEYAHFDAKLIRKQL